ncbi:hypothetical protein NX059_008738 [Plenodomus lindquistii]|nr:hypothetical protein NX059_008738 [Plenodomus lindquistii]
MAIGTPRLVSAYICNSNSKVTITNEQSVSRTTTFGASIGDPFGVVSASTESSTEESASQSFSYEYTPDDSQCGHLSWTPYFECVSGKIPDCDGHNQLGEVCTAKRINDNQLDGA